MKIAEYKLIDLPRVADPRGNLSFIQGGASLPFEIERCYWVYDVPGGEVRHGRALRRTSEMIVALSGSFDVVLDCGDGVKHTVHLCRGYKGVVVPPMCWREIVDFSTNSVAMVLASNTYDPSEYIFDYGEFLETSCGESDTKAYSVSDEPLLPIADNIGPAADPHKETRLQDCGLCRLPRHLHPNGSLTVVQNDESSLFSVRRVFYLYDVPADSERGGHSHYRAEELIVAVSGSFDVTLDDGNGRRTFTLDRPYQALYIKAGIWRTLENFSGGAVCLVLTSEKYSESDYVRQYSEFVSLKKCPPPCAFPFLDLKKAEAKYIGEVREAVLRVIDSGRYIGGDEVTALEVDLCRLTGASRCVGTGNGLDALRLIFRGYIAMGLLSAGDEVIVPANTYIASVLAVTECGLTPVFVEPSPVTMNLDTARLRSAISPRTRAVMPVHLYGRACWDKTLVEVAAEHNLLVIEDNAQAIGATAVCDGLSGSRFTGGLGHAAAFSFYPTKNIGAAGDSGAVTTNNPLLADTVAALRNYGSDRRYHNIYEGYNSRLDPVQAAVIRAKLRHLDEITECRRSVAGVYLSEIVNPAVTLPLPDAGAVWHQFVVRVEDRKHFRDYLSMRGVQTDVHYAVPPHRQPCYRRFSELSLPITDAIASQVVSLPVSPATSTDDAIAISQIINDYVPGN